MSNSNNNSNSSLIVLVFAGIGVGVLGGALIGMFLGRRASRRSCDEMAETVQGLQEKARLVLSELSESVAGLADKTYDRPDAESERFAS